VIIEPYIAFLYNMRDDLPVPCGLHPLTATNDPDAKKEVVEWAASVPDLIEDGALLMVKQGNRGVASQSV